LNRGFTAEEICVILEKCGASGVTSINVGDLHVTFAGQRCNDKGPSINLPGQAWNPELAKKEMAQSELDLMDDTLAELQLTDPVRYEELLATKEFTD
jgi:hypothetical protein